MIGGGGVGLGRWGERVGFGGVGSVGGERGVVGKYVVVVVVRGIGGRGFGGGGGVGVFGIGLGVGVVVN